MYSLSERTREESLVVTRNFILRDATPLQARETSKIPVVQKLARKFENTISLGREAACFTRGGSQAPLLPWGTLRAAKTVMGVHNVLCRHLKGHEQLIELEGKQQFPRSSRMTNAQVFSSEAVIPLGAVLAATIWTHWPEKVSKCEVCALSRAVRMGRH